MFSRFRGSIFRAFVARLPELPLGLRLLYRRRRLALRRALALARLLAWLTRPRHLRRLRLEQRGIRFLGPELSQHRGGAAPAIGTVDLQGIAGPRRDSDAERRQPALVGCLDVCRRHRCARLRQQRRRVDGLAGARRAVPLGRAQDWPARRRTVHGHAPSRPTVCRGSWSRTSVSTSASRSDRAAARSSITISRPTASTSSRSGCRPTTTTTSRDLPIHTISRSASTGGASRSSRSAASKKARLPRAGAARSTATPNGRSTRCRCTTISRCACRSSAGQHEVGIAFVRKSWESEDVAQPRQGGWPLSSDEMFDSNPGVDTVIVEGPHVPTGPGDTPSRRRIFTCQPRGGMAQACARTILSTIAHRAYRRPLSDRDVQTLMEFYNRGRDGGFEAGIQHGLERILVSPDFLFRIEQDPRLRSGQARRRGRRQSLSPDGRRAGEPLVVLPLEQHSGRRAARRRRSAAS